MQDQPSRPTQKSYMLAQSSQDQAREAVQNALVLNPEMPAEKLADWIESNLDPEIKTGLSSALRRIFLLREIRSTRRRTANEAQMHLPGFEHLPLTLRIPGKLRISLLDANYRKLRTYYRHVVTERESRSRNDPKILELKALLDKMQKRAGRDRGITVREVILLDR